MSKKPKKARTNSDFVRETERYALNLLWKATKGANGKKPKNAPDDPSEMPAWEPKEEKSLLDSMIKLASARHKIDPEEDDSSDLDDIRRRLQGDGNAS